VVPESGTAGTVLINEEGREIVDAELRLLKERLRYALDPNGVVCDEARGHGGKVLLDQPVAVARIRKELSCDVPHRNLIVLLRLETSKAEAPSPRLRSSAASAADPLSTQTMTFLSRRLSSGLYGGQRTLPSFISDGGRGSESLEPQIVPCLLIVAAPNVP
jgi:hypothetical protein